MRRNLADVAAADRGHFTGVTSFALVEPLEARRLLYSSGFAGDVKTIYADSDAAPSSTTLELKPDGVFGEYQPTHAQITFGAMGSGSTIQSSSATPSYRVKAGGKTIVTGVVKDVMHVPYYPIYGYLVIWDEPELAEGFSMDSRGTVSGTMPHDGKSLTVSVSGTTGGARDIRALGMKRMVSVSVQNGSLRESDGKLPEDQRPEATVTVWRHHDAEFDQPLPVSLSFGPDPDAPEWPEDAIGGQGDYEAQQSDFSGLRSSITIPAGESSASFKVRAEDDPDAEAYEGAEGWSESLLITAEGSEDLEGAGAKLSITDDVDWYFGDWELEDSLPDPVDRGPYRHVEPEVEIGNTIGRVTRQFFVDDAWRPFYTKGRESRSWENDDNDVDDSWHVTFTETFSSTSSASLSAAGLAIDLFSLSEGTELSYDFKVELKEEAGQNEKVYVWPALLMRSITQDVLVEERHLQSDGSWGPWRIVSETNDLPVASGYIKNVDQQGVIRKQRYWLDETGGDADSELSKNDPGLGVDAVAGTPFYIPGGWDEDNDLFDED